MDSAQLFERLARYNVSWNSPSKDASGSMPIGNGDFAANVWVEEETGDLLLLLAKSDAWDENSINLKLGRVRIRLSPDPLRSKSDFRQTLDLKTATIEITNRDITLRVWADANRPVIHIEATGGAAFDMIAALEMWRTEPRTIRTQTGDIFRDLSGKDPHPTIISPDQVLSSEARDRIVWCHHNHRREIDGYEINMRLQGLGGMIDQRPHPLMGRTFGAAIFGNRFTLVGDRTLQSSNRQSHELQIHALTLHPAAVELWQQGIDASISTATASACDARREHDQWWSDFWNRSWLFVDAPDAFHITQSYILQRYMNACAGRGAQPIKFNGSLFTVGKPDDPDFRRWGGPGFWFQNMRLIYWPMLAMGDFDLMLPWLRMYRDQLPLQKHRTQTYFHHGGAHYPETIMFWGAEVSAHYGWTPFEQRARPEAECSYLTYYWSGGIELVLILLEYFQHFGDENFAREFLWPVADAVTEFFDLHYPRDANGQIRFQPAQSLETWHDATNPLPEIAGLRYVLARLLAAATPAPIIQARCARMLGELPSIPVGEKDGLRVLLPAERFDKKKNTENPELYGIFPYRMYGISKPDLELARNTFAARLHASHDCWSQDDIQMALLGLTDHAREWVTKRASPASHGESRFPAFWNAFHDWIPDMDHGGVLQMAIQLMLMQCEGREIRLLPAWPTEWEADFKLCAPFQTVVQGKVRGGKLIDLRVTPESRAGDVILPKPA